MGCEGAIISSSINGLVVGLVVGMTLGLIKGLEGGDRNITSWCKELVPQCAVVGLVIGFSHSLLANCTGILQPQ